MEASSQTRGEAVRTMLVEYVDAHPARRRPRVWGTALVLVGVVLGAGVSTAAFAATSLISAGPQQPVGQPTADLPDAIVAPAGVTPGAPVVVLLGEPLTVAFSATATVPIAARPEAATHVRVTVVPTRSSSGDGVDDVGGSLRFGTDSGGNNPSLSWTAADLAPGADSSTWYDFPLDATVSHLYLDGTGTAVVTLQYVTHVPTRLGVNVAGMTYGVAGSDQGEPDLIAVVATNGADGYVYRTDLEETDGTTAAERFTTPEDALAWQEAHAGVLHVLSVYESDGTTQIGEFRVG